MLRVFSKKSVRDRLLSKKNSEQEEISLEDSDGKQSSFSLNSE